MAASQDRESRVARLQQAVAAQEALRGQLSDAVLEASLAPLREALAALRAADDGAPGARATAAGDGGVAVGGNVYGDVNLGAGADRKVDPEALRAAYLGKVLAESGRLSLAGVDPRLAAQSREDSAAVDLDAVYTALRTDTPRRQPAADRSEARFDREGAPRLSALEALDREPRLVLLGDPGSGKSTFVNFVALCLAGALLDHARLNLDLLRAPLPDENGEPGETPQPWARGALLPVPVVLRDFARRGLNGNPDALWRFIAAELKGKGIGDYAPLLRAELLEHGGLVLLDGLDEVPEAEQRREQVKHAVSEFADTYGRCRLLLTSRPYAYHHQDWRIAEFRETSLAALDDGQIRYFVSRWYRDAEARGQVETDQADNRATLLAQAIFGQRRLRELAARPLLLTLMASLHAWRGGTLPERREALYADAVDLLLDSWERRRLKFGPDGKPLLAQPSLAEWLHTDRAAVRGALESLAYQAHAEQRDRASTADIAESALVDGLLAIGANLDARPKRLIEYLRDRAGLLVVRGVGVYTLAHRSLQEYLAACYLTAGDRFPGEVARLARDDPDRWREVVLLAGAKAARGAAATAWQLADELCCLAAPAEGVAAEDADLWGAHLAGLLLCESATLDNLSSASDLKLARIKDWLPRLLRGAELPAGERALAGRSLATLGDPRPEVMTLDGMQFCRVPAGDFEMGSDEDDGDSWDDERPRHRVEIPYEYWLGRYPVTVAQFRAYVEASGRTPQDEDSLKGSANTPVAWVSWDEASEFCAWLSERWSAVLPAGWRVALPSEAEWEQAARGGLRVPKQATVRVASEIASDVETAMRDNERPAQRYPWGDEADPERANYDETGIGAVSVVGCFPEGASPYGCEELSGNVWEWTRSLWVEDYPYPPPGPERKARESLEVEGARVVRGGGYFRDRRGVRCASRDNNAPVYRLDFIGFRVVVSPFFSER